MPHCSPPVLLVDDEPAFLESADLVLRAAGVGPVVTLRDSREVMPFLSRVESAVVVMDLSMPHLPGGELLAKIREEHPEVAVIILTGRNDVGTAVGCMKAGAIDYLVKPIENSRFATTVRRALEAQSLRNELSALRERLLSPRPVNEDAFSEILTNSDAMRAVFAYVEAIAPSREAVLVLGETGTGKELVARAVHRLSGRKGPFVAVDIAGLDDAMFSDTLFGHRRGAFTGAEQSREGLVAQAAGGTLFLDEIGDLRECSQVKLLRLLEERSYYPVGSDVTRLCDARVVCATHRNLRESVAAGAFRKDLYYRLAGHQVTIPPLRERPEDLPLLLGRFLEEAAERMGRGSPTAPPELVTLLRSHPFPGNVRELKMMICDAVARHPGGVLSMASFRERIRARTSSADAAAAPGTDPGSRLLASARLPTLKEAEQLLVAEALRRSGANQGIAASLLGITRQALNKRLVRDARRSRSDF